VKATELNRATLARQMLLEREKTTVVKAVERLAGMQAQEPRPPFVGLWTRLDDFDGDELRTALQSGKLLRGTLMRATLHLVSARDYKAYRPALQPVLDASLNAVLKARKSSDLDREAVEAAARELLAKKSLTFDEIRASLHKAFGGDDRSLGYATRMRLPLIMEPGDGDTWGFPRTARFGLAETGRADAKKLARAYLAAFGPATAADFQTWSGLPKAELERITPELEEVARGVWDLPGAPRPDADTPAPVRFLPDFDNLLLAYADRTRIIADEHRPRVATKNLRIKATFLVDGRVAGTWKASGSRVELEPFGKLARTARRQLDEEAERLAGFLKAQR
jgi:Winged helix DNA-binding domain